MGPKKRNLPPRSSKPPQTEDRATVDGGVSPNINLTDDLPQEQSKIDPLVPSAYAPIKLESDRALTALRRGNHTKALRLMKDACLRHENCALVYRAQGNVQVKVASIIDDNAAKQRHLKNAVESARRAASLSANSIEFASFYANLLYDVSSDGKDYEEVVRECERALSIDNPIDPAKESLQDESQSKVSKAEERIANLREGLQSLVQKCRIKNLETSGPIEIKKAIKEPAMRRSEIEVRVAAARLLQQMERHEERTFDVNTANIILSERRKQASLKMFMPSAMRMGEFRSFWNSMSVEKKRGLLELRILDLRGHFSSFKDGLAAKTFSDAIGFAQKNETWKFWPCCFCDEKFKDSELRIWHIKQDHNKNISSLVQYLVPQEVDADWADMLVNCTWRPVDTPRAVKIIEKQSKSPLADLGREDRMQGCTDEAQFSYKEPNKGQVSSGSDDISKFGLGESGGNLQPMASPGDQKWPLSDDVERAKILERIHAEFQVLLSRKCLSWSNLKLVIEDTLEELKKFVPMSQLLIHGLDQTPLCICFLEVPQLMKILQFLQAVSDISSLSRYLAKGSSLDDAVNENVEIEIKERIDFNADSSRLLLDERLLQGELTSHGYQDAVADGGSAVTCTIRHDEVDVLPETDALIRWLFSGPLIGEELTSWEKTQDTMKHQEMYAIQIFEKEFDVIETWRTIKRELKSQEEGLQAIKSICMEELEKREQDTKHIPQSYASLLSRRQEELVGADGEAMSHSSRYELDAILSTLTEVQTLNVNQFGFEGALTSDHEHQEDACIRIAIQRQIDEEQSAELIEVQEIVKRCFYNTRQLGLKFMQASSQDYRSIMLPLLKSFMRAQFEALVNEDAKQKSDAAREAFLSELALDAEKNISKGGMRHTKLPQENSKAKKKKKNHRKVKDLKATCGDEQYVMQEENELAHVPVGYDGDYPSSEIVVAVSADELELQEEELKHEIEQEVEERKLEEMLEYYRQIEDEAKQKNLDKLKKNTVAPITEEVEKMVVARSTLSDDSGPGVPVSTLEETKVPGNSCRASASQETLLAQKNLPSTTSQRVPSKVSLEEFRVWSTDFTSGSISVSDIFGPGLRNDVGENNCFLNVIVQSLWHLRKFRDEFLSRSQSEHVHIGDPCVVCALHELFNALNMASANMPKEAVSSTNLRIALSNLRPDGNIFEEVQMNDASKVLAAILGFLHQSFNSGSIEPDTESARSNCTGSWDCASDVCLAHSIFGMDICQKMNCNNCGIESEQKRFTYFYHFIRAVALRGMKIDYAESPFDELLELAELHHYRICDPEVGGCGELNNLHNILSTPPHVFTTVLGWESTIESVDDISAILRALTTEIEIGIVYEGVGLGNRHSLISMVCYYRQHFICFVYSHEYEKWIMYDDEIVKAIGCWDDVLTMCEKSYLQPQVLFFEAV